jgi:hypothetical protein
VAPFGVIAIPSEWAIGMVVATVFVAVLITVTLLVLVTYSLLPSGLTVSAAGSLVPRAMVATTVLVAVLMTEIEPLLGEL